MKRDWKLVNWLLNLSHLFKINSEKPPKNHANNGIEEGKAHKIIKWMFLRVAMLNKLHQALPFALAGQTQYVTLRIT